MNRLQFRVKGISRSLIEQSPVIEYFVTVMYLLLSWNVQSPKRIDKHRTSR